MKKIRGVILSAGMLSGSAFGNCWMECVMVNPITGACVQKVKMCDIENPGRAAADFSEGIRKGAGQLVEEWHNLWGTIPDSLRIFLEQYPLTIASIIYPDTRAYSLVVAAIEDYYHRAARRSHDIADIARDAPKWKQDSLKNGLKVILMAENLLMSETQFEAETYRPINEFNEVPWQEYLSCERAATTPETASQCVTDLRIKLLSRMGS